MNYAKVTRIFLVLMLMADIITENPVFNSCLHLGIWNLCAIINHSGQPFLSCCALFLSWCFYDDILFFFFNETPEIFSHVAQFFERGSYAQRFNSRVYS